MFGDLAVGSVTGIFSGGYTGFVIARYTKFRDLRDEALRIVRGIEYVADSANLVTKITGYDSRRMSLIISDLLGSKHKESGSIISGLDKKIVRTVLKAEASGVLIDEVFKADSQAQEEIRKTTPSFLALLSLTPRI
ncbi:hypothetical protein [Vreelandella boliviensis]|uniref:Uncharacterized protein n=1 Tax=Vreelandella boliviensis LC1 TaxID=1072583 RepID=A0ABX4G9W6_9GAMM|nr:hypothetical protein [Halomonas boliviensis]OZT72571.1 hypothetical protein CE457_18745 [Halomonas boliviensis LC1]